MKPYLLIICALVISADSHAQLDILQKVQENRFMAKACQHEGNYDSACIFFQNFIKNEEYSNPYDYLNFSFCSLRRNDTTAFEKYLGMSIEQGMDTEYVYNHYKNHYKKATENEKKYLDNFLIDHFEKLHQSFLAHYDTVLINYIKSMADLDQIARRSQVNWKDDSNINYLKLIGRITDSVNYLRLVQLFETNRFPGYHNCGAKESDLTICLLHLGDHDENHWQYIFKNLKIKLLEGAISPDELALIADRHYNRLANNPCYYYGHSRMGLTLDFCDCKNVDNLRHEIGLEDLRMEYEKNKTPIPDCYTSRSAK